MHGSCWLEKHASSDGGEPEETFSQMLTQGKKFEYIQKIKLTIDEWQMRKLSVTRLSQEPTLNNMDYFRIIHGLPPFILCLLYNIQGTS